MELSRASIEEIVAELAKRQIEFSLIVRSEDPDAGDDDSPDYQIFGTHEQGGEATVSQAVRCLMGGLHVLTSLSDTFDDQEDFGRAHDAYRWVAVLELLLNDLFQTSEDWSDID